MEINLIRKLDGLHPCDNDDYDKLRKLPMGKAIKVSANVHRNYRFHKKFFKLIKTAWEMTLKLALFYNAKVLVEATRTSVLTYFINNHK